MPTPSTKKKVKKVAEDPLSSSGVSSLSGISSYNIRKISIFKNGDRYHRGVKFVINPRIVKDMEPLLNQINDRIELSHGAKKLYTTDGKVISSIKELEDGKIYIAASAQFIPMRYGEFAEKVWKPPSRKHSPILSSDRIKTARTRSQDPSKRRQPQNSGTTQTSGSGVQRSRSVRTLTEDRKSRRDISHGTTRSNINGSAASSVPKKFDQPRPKAPPPKPMVPKQTRPTPTTATTTKKPPVPKRKISKKVLGAAAGAGIAVVGAAALGVAAAASKKGKPMTPKPKPIPTGVSDISTASSIIPAPNVESGAAEILEFPEEIKQIDMATIHRTPTPPVVPSRSASAKSLKKPPQTPAAERSAKVMEAKSVSQQPSPESSEEDEGHEEEDDDDVADDEEDDGSDEVEEPSDDEEEEDEDEEEEEEEDDEDAKSRVETPASRKSSAVSAAASHDDTKEKEVKK